MRCWTRFIHRYRRFLWGWKLGARAKGKRLGTLRAFFRFCMNRKWLHENPVSADIKPPIGANRVANKAPYTDEELQRIIDACDRMPDIAWSSGLGRGLWTGEDVKDFIWVMVYTGLRISDVGLFHMNRLKGNEVFLRAKKNGGEVFAYVPDWLRDRLNARARRCGLRPFIVGHSDRLETVTDMWRRKIGKVFDLAGEFDEPPTPHRFRHTFARILLQRGVPVADVADLLGDDEDTVREHYARWVPERQARLTKILKDAFDDKPKPEIGCASGQPFLAGIQQARMYPLRGGFRDAVDRVRLFAAHPYLDNAGIVFYQLPHCLASQAPQTREFADAVVLFESGVLD